jgi:environmental stress-induced protein Ves
VRDFNVMFNEQARGELRAFQLQSTQRETISISQKRIILFVHTGQYSIGEQLLEAGSVLDIEACEWTSISLECIESGTILCTQVELL